MHYDTSNWEGNNRKRYYSGYDIYHSFVNVVQTSRIDFFCGLPGDCVAYPHVLLGFWWLTG